MAYLIFRLSLMAVSFLSIVIPNSLQVETAASLVVCSFFSIFVMRKTRRLLAVFSLYGLSVLVTIAYVLVGVIRGASIVAVAQIITVYVVSPLLWILVSAAVQSRIRNDKLIGWISLMTIFASASVAMFFYLFLTYGADSVAFFIETANINLNDGYVGATMSVYGSFIFLTGAFFSSPTIIRNLAVRLICLTSILIVVFTSGRSALILSLFVGLAIFLIFRKTEGAEKISNGGLIALFAVFLIAASVYVYVSSVDLSIILQIFYEELTSGGGRERVEQAIALLQGTVDTWALGAGHGIGVDYIRSEDYPWRYELVWVATLYRVGLIGFMIYFLPVIFYIFKFMKFYRAGVLTEMDIFMFGGFVCALVASNTNPYAEAFIFQWMYVVPFVFMMLKSKENLDA